MWIIRRAFVLPTLLGAILAACSSPSHPSERLEGSFEGRWDDAPWRGRAYAVLRGDTLYVGAHRPDPKYFYDEHVQAQVLFSGAGTYPIRGRAGQLARITGGDAGHFPDAEGTLVVHSYNDQTRTVMGELYLHAESMQPAWQVQGQFRAPVYTSFTEVPPARRR